MIRMLHRKWGAPFQFNKEIKEISQFILIEALYHSSAMQALLELEIKLGIAHLPTDLGADVCGLNFVYSHGEKDQRIKHRRSSWPTPPNSLGPHPTYEKGVFVNHSCGCLI